MTRFSMSDEQFKILIEAIITHGVLCSRFSKTPMEDVQRAKLVVSYLLGENK